MSKKNAHKAIKKREKQRAKRRRAQVSRGSRSGPETTVSMRAASSWPVHEAWASMDWYEQGAVVQLCFSRRHSDGRLAAAFFEADLAQGDVPETKVYSGISQDQLNGLLSQRSTDQVAMVAVEPALVARILHDALVYGKGPDQNVAKGYAEGVALFGDVRAEDSDEEVLCGLQDTDEVPRPPPASAATGGWLGKLKRAVGMG